jgi:hypothetical protein
MKKLLPRLALAALAALAACAHTGAWADMTYTYTGDNYTAPMLNNYTNPACPAGGCGAFTTGMNQHGWFTTAQPLPAGLNGGDILPYITDFSFSDGLTTYSKAAGDILDGAWATTAANGSFIDAALVLAHWHTPAAPGASFDTLILHQGVTHNSHCTSVNMNGFCSGTLGDAANTSWISGTTNGTWAVTGQPAVAPSPQSVPVDNPFALALATLGVLGTALRGRRRMLLKR